MDFNCKFSKIIVNFLFLLLVLLLLSGCNTLSPKIDKQPKKATETNKIIKSNIFDATKVKVGDQVAGMKIIAHNAKAIADLKEYGPMGTIDFSGQVTVSGTYTCFKQDELLGDGVKFEVAQASLAKIPKMDNDTRKVWFMFKNQDKAQMIFGTEVKSGKATIIIKDYSICFQPSDVYNSATLIEASIIK